MFLILAFMRGAVVWGFSHANPRGVDARWLLACNLAILVLGVVLAVGGLVRNLLLFPLERRRPA